MPSLISRGEIGANSSIRSREQLSVHKVSISPGKGGIMEG